MDKAPLALVRTALMSTATQSQEYSLGGHNLVTKGRAFLMPLVVIMGLRSRLLDLMEEHSPSIGHFAGTPYPRISMGPRHSPRFEALGLIGSLRPTGVNTRTIRG